MNWRTLFDRQRRPFSLSLADCSFAHEYWPPDHWRQPATTAHTDVMCSDSVSNTHGFGVLLVFVEEQRVCCQDDIHFLPASATDGHQHQMDIA